MCTATRSLLLTGTQVNVQLSLKGHPDKFVTRSIIFGTGSNCQSVDAHRMATMIDPTDYPAGTILPE